MPLHPTRSAPPPPPSSNINNNTYNNTKYKGLNNNEPIYIQKPTVIRSNAPKKKQPPPPRPAPPKNYVQKNGTNNFLNGSQTRQPPSINNYAGISQQTHNLFRSNTGPARKRIAPIPSPLKAQIQRRNLLKDSLIDLDTPTASPQHSATALHAFSQPAGPKTLLDMDLPEITNIQAPLLPPTPITQHRSWDQTFTNELAASFSTMAITGSDSCIPSHVNSQVKTFSKKGVFSIDTPETIQKVSTPINWSNEPSDRMIKTAPSKSTPTEKKGKVLIALYDFNGEEVGDLKFKEGDKIYLINELNWDWWIGECNGKQGQFPSNFVAPKDSKASSPPIKLERKSSDATQIQKPLDIMLALYDFPADQEGDLPLKIGDEVKVLYEINSEWLFGECHGVKGQFPFNFVGPSPEKSSSSPPPLGVFVALYDFPSEQDTDLELKTGDKVLVTECIDKNWWRGMSIKNDKEGVFPAEFVQRLES